MSFEILCVTMHQTDFSKIKEMNIQSNVVFANQSDCVRYDEFEFNGNTAKMITTNTRGVGINRNLALMYASADICLFADDDVCYYDGYKEKIIEYYEKNPKADVVIFNFKVSRDGEKEKDIVTSGRRLKKRHLGKFGTYCITARKNSLLKTNIWFITLFGGGTKYSSGEDSLFLLDCYNNKLRIYACENTLGFVHHKDSTWFTGYDEKFYFGKGAFYQVAHKRTFWIWMQYFLFRTRKFGSLSRKQKKYWIKQGRKAFKQGKSFEEFIK